MDPPLHPVPRQAPPGRDGRLRGRAVPQLARRRGAGGRVNPEPGAERAAVSLSLRPASRAPLARRRRSGEATEALADCPDSRRSSRRHLQAGRDAAPHGRSALRLRAAPARVRPPESAGHRLRDEPDHGPRRQGRQGSRHRAGSSCHGPSLANTRTQGGNGHGSRCFPLLGSTSTGRRASAAVITCTSLFCSAPCSTPFGGRGLANALHRTRFDIPSPPICSKTAATSAPSRNCWATTTSARR